MMDRVLFGQAYFLRFDPKLWAAQQPYAPLGTLYAAACVRERGYEVSLFDAMLASSQREWVEMLDRLRPRFAVVYEDSFNYLSKMCLLRMREAALSMVSAARKRGAQVIVAGSDATDHASTYLAGGADVVVTGEGEATLVEVLDTLSGRAAGGLEAIDGVCYARETGVVRTRRRELIRELDGLPYPAWDLVDVEQYRRVWLKRHGYFSMNLSSTRGCPYHCNWCAKPIYGQHYTARSPESVAREVEWLGTTYRPDHLWIADDIFGLKPGWVEQFAQLLASRGAAIPFKCLMRADGVTDPIVSALRTARCRTVWIGAESGSQKILDAMEKGVRVEQIRQAAARLHAAGIEVGFFLQFGYPGETKEEIAQTLDMVRTCRPDDIGISVSYPLPGTPFYERVKSELGAKQNWVDSDDLDLMYSGTYVAEYYRALHALTHADFRARRVLEPFGPQTRPSLRSRRQRLRATASGLWQAVRLPLLRHRLRRLSRLRSPNLVPVLSPRLSPQAAAVPTEQPGA